MICFRGKGTDAKTIATDCQLAADVKKKKKKKVKV